MRIISEKIEKFSNGNLVKIFECILLLEDINICKEVNKKLMSYIDEAKLNCKLKILKLFLKK